MSIIEHVTLQKIVAHDFRYDPRIWSIEKDVHRILVGRHERNIPLEGIIQMYL